MKLYKFRQLGNCYDLERIEEIIEEKKFWCSKLWDLNDPMEGVFWSFKENVDKIFKEKNQYLICSFSGEKGFKNPLLWGYYANGFKGIAIEIEIEKKRIEKVKYVTLKKFNEPIENEKEIIKRKLNNWKHENEYRFLIKSDCNKQENSKSLRKYRRYRDKLKIICENNKIEDKLYNVNG